MGFFKPPRLPFEERPKLVTQNDLQQFKQQAGASLLALNRLQELDLSACDKLTDSSITQVGGQCVCVCVCVCFVVETQSISKSQVSALFLLCSLPQVVRYPDLHSLSLSMLPEITDASLASVAWHCRSLTSLALSHCPGISDRGVAQAVPYLQRLQHLYLSCCNNITDR